MTARPVDDVGLPVVPGTLVDDGRFERPDADVVLRVRDLDVSFPSGDGLVRAVRGLSYEVRPGEVLGIVGESGSGKSVSSLAVMGLLPKSARITGSIAFRGEELLGRKDKALNAFRGKKIAMIFQDPMTSLNPVYNVGWQVAEAVRAHQHVSKKAALDRAVELLDIVGIPNPRARAASYPHEFSGGMRQRAVIAVAMANDPDLIIADEPTTALDVTVQAQVLEALSAAREATGSAMVLITHDLGVVASAADRMLVMYAGKEIEVGTVDDIYYGPRMPYTLGLIGSLPRLDTDGTERLVPISGSPPSLINLPPGCPFEPRCPMSSDRCVDEEPALVRVGVGEHRAACHFSDQLAGDVAAAEIFDTNATDAELFAPDPEVVDGAEAVDEARR